MASHHSSRKHAKRTPRIAGSDPKPRVAEARKSNPGRFFPDFDSAMAAMKERLNVEQLRQLLNQRNVLYEDPKVDISSAVITNLDSKYKAGGGAAATGGGGAGIGNATAPVGGAGGAGSPGSTGAAPAPKK